MKLKKGKLYKARNNAIVKCLWKFHSEIFLCIANPLTEKEYLLTYDSDGVCISAEGNEFELVAEIKDGKKRNVSD